MFSQKSLKLLSVSGFPEIDSAQIFEVGLHILHDSTEQVPVLVESEEEVDATIFRQFSLSYL